MRTRMMYYADNYDEAIDVVMDSLHLFRVADEEMDYRRPTLEETVKRINATLADAMFQIYYLETITEVVIIWEQGDWSDREDIPSA